MSSETGVAPSWVVALYCCCHLGWMDVAALVEIDESIHEGAMGKDVVSIDAVEGGVAGRV